MLCSIAACPRLIITVVEMVVTAMGATLSSALSVLPRTSSGALLFPFKDKKRNHIRTSKAKKHHFVLLSPAFHKFNYPQGCFFLFICHLMISHGPTAFIIWRNVVLVCCLCYSDEEMEAQLGKDFIEFCP